MRQAGVLLFHELMIRLCLPYDVFAGKAENLDVHSCVVFFLYRFTTCKDFPEISFFQLSSKREILRSSIPESWSQFNRNFMKINKQLS